MYKEIHIQIITLAEHFRGVYSAHNDYFYGFPYLQWEPYSSNFVPGSNIFPHEW